MPTTSPEKLPKKRPKLVESRPVTVVNIPEIVESAKKGISAYQENESNWGQNWETALDTHCGPAYLYTEKGHPVDEDAMGAIETPSGVCLYLCDGVSTSGTKVTLEEMETMSAGKKRNERKTMAPHVSSHTVVRELMARKPYELMMEAIMRANAAIENGNTTLMAAEIINDKLLIYWSGNSRIKVYRRNTNHEYELVYTNRPNTSKQAKKERSLFPYQTVECLGRAHHPTVYTDIFQLRPGDIICMESDGLTGRDADTVPVLEKKGQSDPLHKEFEIDYTGANNSPIEKKRCQEITVAAADPHAIAQKSMEEAHKIPNNDDDKTIIVMRFEKPVDPSATDEVFNSDETYFLNRSRARDQRSFAEEYNSQRRVASLEYREKMKLKAEREESNTASA